MAASSYPLAPCRAPWSGPSTPSACSSGRARGSSSPSAWRTSRRSSAPGSGSRWRASACWSRPRCCAAPCAPTCCWPASIGMLPFATSYGLIYWAEQYVTSGLAAVLFGVLPLYVALLAAFFLPDEPLRPRLLVGVGIAFGGLVAGVRREPRPRAASTRRWRPPRSCWRRSRARSATSMIKLRGQRVDPLVMNGWAMVIGGVAAARRLRAQRGLGRDHVVAGLDRLDPLPRRGRDRLHVRDLTVLLRELPAVTVSFISMIIPFGALALGAAVPRRDA